MRISDWSSDVCSSDLTTNPQRFAELGCTDFSDNAGAVVDPCNHVLWWQFSASPSSGQPPWTRAETVALAAAGVEIQSSAARLDAEMRSRSEEHTSELQSLMRISYAVFCLKKKKKKQ